MIQFILDIVILMTLAFTIYRFIVINYRTLSQENLKALIALYEGIKEDNSLLECYGIAKEDLDEINLTVNQFVHLVQDFTAGQIFFDTTFEFRRNNSFWVGSYRYNLCALKTTRDALPYLEKFFPPTSDYGRLIKKTVTEISAQSPMHN